MLLNAKFLTLLLICLLFLTLAGGAEAALLTINREGRVIWKVLSETSNLALSLPPKGDLKVKEAAKSNLGEGASVSLSKDSGRISLVVEEGQAQKNLDVTSWAGGIIEIEERPEMEKLTISILSGKFGLEQKGITATTEFPINIKSKKGELSVSTPSGERLVLILPRLAVDTALRAKSISYLSGQDAVQLVERGGELAYSIDGVKSLNFFNIFKHQVPVRPFISATTGEVLLIEEPVWLKALGFIFS